jgi:hypothetical protein
MKTARERAPRSGAAAGAQLDRALKEFLKAFPIGHLDRRLVAFERWFTGVEREVRRSGLRVGRAAAETARIAVMGPPPARRGPRGGGTAPHGTR